MNNLYRQIINTQTMKRQQRQAPGPPPTSSSGTTITIEDRVKKKLEELCMPPKSRYFSSKQPKVTLKDIVEAIKGIPLSAVESSPFLLLACAKVGIGDEEIINHLVNFAPQSLNFSSYALYPKYGGEVMYKVKPDGSRGHAVQKKSKAYPIHAACMNVHFPDSALRVLIEKYLLCNCSALQHSCSLDTGYMNVNMHNKVTQ